MGMDLKGILSEWRVPDPQADLDARIAATYSALRGHPVSRWMRSVRVPAPVLALLLLLQLVSALVVGHYLFFGNSAMPPARVIEVPVVRERIVNHVVYLPANVPGDSRSRATAPPAAQADDARPMDLTGFQPVSDLQIRVIKGENKNER